jgi:rhodanese-related sulfurtransferase
VPEYLAHAIVLDSRDEGAFARGHLAGAGRLSHAEFREHRAELPPRTAKILVVDDDPAEARRAATTLALLGYREVRWLDDPLASLPAGHADTGSPARLWRPSPFLERMLPELPRGRALDLAAGSGRDAVYLALHGWRAEAWDHDPVALKRADALAARTGVEVATRIVELGDTAPAPPGSRWDVIVVVRFLHRPILPWIQDALAPGGALVYETFRTGQERYGRPKNPQFLLEPGELRSSFPALVVEHYEEVEPEGGPILARLLARRRA